MATDHRPHLSPAKVMVPITFAVLGVALLIASARLPWQPNFLESFLVLAAYIAWLAAVCWLALALVVKFAKQHPTRNSYFGAWLAVQAINFCLLKLFYSFAPDLSALQHLPLLPTLLMTAIVVALALRHGYVLASWKHSQWQAQQAQSQVESARIRPHFLFNTLNAIAELTRIDPSAAEQSIENLAQLYRSNLAKQNQHALLDDELRTARSYLYIEQHRIGNRMTQQWDTDDLPNDAKLPILTIQPLVENAVYHGIGPHPEGGTVSIKGWREAGELLIEITNPMPDFERTNRHVGNKMAVDNIRQRLQTTFGDRASMNVEKTHNEYRVTLRFPYVTNEVQG